jgi:hypothetical protein
MFKLTSVIKAPEGSITIGLAEAAAVYAIYMAAVPNHTDIRSADPHNVDVEASRKRAAWQSAAVIGLVFLITQDLNSFLIGGAAIGGIDLMVKHANAVHPATGKMAGPEAAMPADNDVAFPMADYADTQPVADDAGY